jgi:integrase
MAPSVVGVGPEATVRRFSSGRVGQGHKHFYAELRRCRARCDRRSRIDHRTETEHECDDRCAKQVCRPLGASYLRQIHTVLNGAFTRAVRWRWIGSNPVREAEAPPQPAPDPNPPSPTQAARIVGEAWRDRTGACSSGSP